MQKTLLLISFGFLFLFPSGEMEKYPVPPKTKELLFYIQRNHNSNTIAYDANFDSLGDLKAKKPIEVYWIRYDELGQKKELRAIERMFAYGLKSKLTNESPRKFQVELVAYEKRRLELVQSGPFRAMVFVKINNRTAQLDHLYINADNSGFWPKVEWIELFGLDSITGQKVYEKILNN
jgi:Domain of unknown function (DUF4833)